MTDLAVRCRSLVKSYGAGDARVTALRGIDLDVRANELLMVVGPSGCGKTTLISLIGAMLGQDSGECVVLGHDLQRLGDAERARLRGGPIGFVFQMFNLLPALSALENVAIPLLIKGTPARTAKSRAREAIEAVGLRSRSNALPSELSGGQQQRVAIARALVHDPKLIVCDEPTSSLDHDTGIAVMDVLRGRGRTQDRALIVVTHDPRIFGFADRIVHMDDGRIVDLTDGAPTQP